MKSSLIAALLAVTALLSGCTPSSASRESIAWGTVESRQEISLAQDMHSYYEHPLRPDVQERIVVRLDDGSVVTVIDEGESRVEPGQRVRVFVGARGAFLFQS
jgi:ABC-type uncharacterized transport system auxiliary subunit